MTESPCSSVSATVLALVSSMTLTGPDVVTAQIALTLAARLDAAEPREAAALAKQLSATLAELSRPEADDDDWTAPSAT